MTRLNVVPLCPIRLDRASLDQIRQDPAALSPVSRGEDRTMHRHILRQCACGAWFVLAIGKPGLAHECEACGEETELERGVVRVQPEPSVMAEMADFDLSEVLR